MLPGEKSLLSELLRKTTWERWGQHIKFESKDARRVQRVIKILQEDSGREVLPVSQIRRYDESFGTLQLESPLPPQASAKKVEEVIIDLGVTRHLQQLDARRERGEHLQGDDMRHLLDWLGSLEEGSRGAPSEKNHTPLSLKELLNEKSWETRGTIPTFLHKGLDEYLGGGIGRGQLAVLQAPYKKGKTTFLLTIAYRAAVRNFTTLYLSCEPYLDQIGERLSQIHALSRRSKPPAKLLVDYCGSLGLRDVRKYLRGRKVDFLIVDYAEKMQASVENDFTWKTTEIYTGLRNLANEFNLVCWTVAQEHDQPEWARESSRTGTFGSRTKGHLADLILGVYVSPRMNQAVFTVLGRRGRGKEGGKFSSRFDLDTAELKEKK